MWGSRYFTARYWQALYFRATGASSRPSVVCVSDASNAITLAETARSCVTRESAYASIILTDESLACP